ncbi:MAG: hypothetical protein JW395_1342 [Nitrospira sp.]|nr:hypothetical protein [Nitrospira sp.]
MNIVRAGLLANQHHTGTGCFHRHGPIRSEGNLPGCRARTGWEAFPQGIGFRFFFRIENWIEILRQLLRPYPLHRLSVRDKALSDHVDRNFHGSNTSPFADPGLQHVELALLNRKLQIKHIPIVFFELLIRALQFFVGLRHILGERIDRKRSPDAGYDILALRIH